MTRRRRRDHRRPATSASPQDRLRGARRRKAEATAMATSIHQEVTIKATPQRIYRAFMTSKQHEAFTANGKAKISRKVGGTFSAHDGYVSGINVELKPGKRIVQA